MTALPAIINPKAVTTRCFRNLDSGETSLGHTCFANVFAIRILDFLTSLDDGGGDVGVALVIVVPEVDPVLFFLSVFSIPLVSMSEIFELFHRFIIVVVVGM